MTKLIIGIIALVFSIGLTVWNISAFRKNLNTLGRILTTILSLIGTGVR